ncbi:uncharacterized protein LOC114278537 [Camellia sinensis]|uniref:uncharacterized protein LOC114278537 n=1 Tax=Camellia sinensis TaxID=4442 RepID=UPI0010367336|nr:uncharacterized protein LOC114278537 [Camellia sinensis]
MANNGQEENIGDDFHSKGEEHVDSNPREENRNEGVEEPNLGENNAGKKRNVLIKGGRDEYYNESDLDISDSKGLRAYAKRYYEVYNRIPACNQELAVMSFKNSLDDKCSLRKSLAKTLPQSMEELMAWIEKYPRAKEDTQGARTPKQEMRNDSPKRGRGNVGADRQETGVRAMQAVSTVFQIPIYKVLERIRNQSYYRAPEKIPSKFMGKNTGKHCAYHNENGHLTQECQALKSHLEDLVR